MMLTNFKGGAKAMSCQFHFDGVVLTITADCQVK